MKKALSLLCVILFLLPVASISAEKPDAVGGRTDLPSTFNWRDINGTDYTTPIKDQSPAPTCEAYGLCAALETLMQYQEKELYNPDLSEAHLYFSAGGTVESGYVNLIDAANYLMEYGVPDEGSCPDPHRAFDSPIKSISGWENRTVKIHGWGWVDQNISTMKSALIEHGPLVICISVWKDYFFYMGGVYKHRWGARVGGHVVTIVGYDDSKSCWIVKNSWGTKWGEKGWFRMAYDADMFADWYGPGTGVMYLDGVYGNLKPDVPKVTLETPMNYKTYLGGWQLPTFLKKLPVEIAAARILGSFTVKVTAENTNSVEFYLDDVLQYRDDTAPFSWDLSASKGLHTLEVKAINNEDTSLDIVDIYVF